MITQRISHGRMIACGALPALICGCWLLAGPAVGQEAAPRAVPATSAAKTVPASRKPHAEEVPLPTIYYLKYADAGPTAQTLAKVVEARDLRATFTPETRLNAIIVQGSPEVHKRVEQLLKELDVPAASPAGQKDARQDQEVRVQIYRLRYAKASRVLPVVSTVFAGESVKLTADTDANSVIVSASPQVQARVAQLIEKLDAPSEPGADRKYQYRIFPLVNAEARDLAKVITTVLGPDEKIAVDERTNSILALAPQDTLLIIDAILTGLDEAADKDLKKYSPGTTFQVRVVWVASELPPDQGAKPADDLKDVVAELAKVGVKEVRQIGQVIVNTMPDGQFQVRCSPVLGERPADLEISGKLEKRQETPALQIRLSASQTEPAPVVGRQFQGGRSGQAGSTAPVERVMFGRPSTKRLVELETTIAAPVGHYVVLGVSPVEKMTSVFVVQVVTTGKP